MSFLVLHEESWLLCFNCLSDALWLLVFCGSSSRCRESAVCDCGIFMIILTYPLRVRLVPFKIFKSSLDFFADGSKAVLLLLIFFVIYVSCLSLLSCLVCSLQPCDHLWKRSDLLVLLCVVFSCVFVTFPYGASGQVRYLIVLIPDLCPHLYFEAF